MKKWFNKQTIFAFILGVAIMLPAGAYAVTKITAYYTANKITVDGVTVKTQMVYVTEVGQAYGRNYVSAGDLSAAMGGTVKWNNGTVEVSTIKEGTVQDVAKQAANCVLIRSMYDTTQKATASGILWGEDFILTNKHVLTGANNWIAEYNDSEQHKSYSDDSRIYETDLDIALIKLPEKHGGTLKVGNSDKVKVGDKVVVISSPHGIKNIVTDGIITKISLYKDSYYFYTNAISHPGSSGGAMLNMNGEMIGLIGGSGNKEGDDDITVAIAVNDIKEELD
jgi:S1-C subfamily serine protease